MSYFQDMKTLEENVEQTLLREEQALEAEEAALNGSSDDVVALQKTLKEMKMKYEVYFASLGCIPCSTHR